MNIYKYISHVCMAMMGLLCLFLIFRLHTLEAPKKQTVILPKPEPTEVILMANKQLYAGQVLQSSDLSGKQLPKAFIQPGTIIDSSSARRNVVGTLLRVSIPQNAALRADDIVHPGEGGFLAALLEPGKRGVAIPVDSSSAVSGLILPGDFVDLILTPIENDQAFGNNKKVVTILKNIHVVAVDSRVTRGAERSINNQNIKNVVLELTQSEAQKVALSEKLGKITLSLRSLEKADDKENLKDDSWLNDILQNDKPKIHEEKIKKRNDLRVFNGIREVFQNAHSD